MQCMEWYLRPARPDEWREAKRLRLEMLADTPIAFARSLAESEAMTDAQWQQGQLRAGQDDNHHVVVTDADGRWLAQAIGKDFGPVTDPPWTSPGIVAVYVSPELRGQGVLGAMVDEIAAWLRSRGHDEMTLMVHEDNHRAIRAYEKLGFALDGTSCPYGLDPSRRDLGMKKRL